ncbi:hypothetical protein [Hydrocarboniclastica marina]|uniref:Uncharacterized protein n=1 Tax=Hydrocarboniclastica marina TaxID=2259620 RepID=A0A4P7XD42_9ALTE|nr:hypothetical protein [Hydrocarboniclastica marina]QCF24789.1 hypothetical protein soil367_01790 [Hydrocarboniclastica marina]|tara:strand:- start:1540 stop:2097 length:558 start_codon:yes stop_codon:yes gene_type:complete
MSLFAFSGRKWSGNLKLTASIAVALLVILSAINIMLVSDEAPRGIISFQFAATPERATGVVQSWQRSDMGASGSGVEWAQASLYLDFAFVAAYLLLLLKLTGHWLIDRPGVREQQLGRWARGLFWTGALTDVAENICLLVTLEQAQSAFWPLVATLFALVKFSSLLAGAAALLILRAARGQPLAT